MSEKINLLPMFKPLTKLEIRLFTATYFPKLDYCIYLFNNLGFNKKYTSIVFKFFTKVNTKSWKLIRENLFFSNNST